jgi:asparagine synthase (glutamine-hydrolysing)
VSGIAAVWRLDGAPLHQVTLDSVSERLAPRIADAVGSWLGGSVGLAHRMLHTTPESFAEKLPLADPDADVVVTADARLDNREDLISALGPAHRVTREAGDGELILRAWARWGEECPAHLLGDFAFAVWDARRRVLFCARDAAGVRPLYYHLGPRLFAAASDVKALVALSDVPRRLDEVRIAAHLVPGLVDREATFYEGIRRLPGGHSLTIGGRHAAPRAYWQLDPTRALAPGSDAAYGEAFRHLFTEAVRGRLRSAGPVAAALSGGLDSSSVTCVARSLLQAAGSGPLITYTARFPTIPGCDEGRYVGAVEAQGGIVSRHVRVDTLDPLGDLERLPAHADERFHTPDYYMHRALYHVLRAEGGRVFLEGTGGDSVLSHGAGYLHELARRGRWIRLAAECRRYASGTGRAHWRTLRGVIGAAAPSSLRRAWWRVRPGGPPWAPVIRSEFARRIDLADRLRAGGAAATARDLEGARREHWRQLTAGRLDGILEILAVSAGGAGIEVRDPFLDRRVMEFCLALPASQKFRNGQTRLVARHGLGEVLPPEIRDRRGKAPIDLMLGAALAAYGRERLARLLDEARQVLAPYVAAEAIARAHRRYLHRGALSDVTRVWSLATLTLWLRRPIVQH